MGLLHYLAHNAERDEDTFLVCVTILIAVRERRVIGPDEYDRAGYPGRLVVAVDLLRGIRDEVLDGMTSGVALIRALRLEVEPVLGSLALTPPAKLHWRTHTHRNGVFQVAIKLTTRRLHVRRPPPEATRVPPSSVMFVRI